jgi:murein DD-endopeptidase MepM/ murein hydrolase activator NlpD
LAFRVLRAPVATPSARPSAGSRLHRVGFSTLLAVLLGVAVVAPASAAWPVASRSSYISQPFHRGHPADDIAAARGTRIVPIFSGRVVFAGWKSNCGGYQVWVYHGGGLYTAYYHMKHETSWRGRWVTKSSSTLGYVGMTGCATGPHTHVEVWHGYPWRSGSYRVNPWTYIDRGTYFPLRYR